MQQSLEKCRLCPRLISCSHKACKPCREKRRLYRLKHIQEEQIYQSKRWAHRAVVHSKCADTLSHRSFEQDKYITPEHLHTIRRTQHNSCFYCTTEMQIKNRRKPNGLTVERLDNTLPHEKLNTVLACFRCNCRSGSRV